MYNVRPWYVVFDHRGHQRESMADASCQQSAPKSVDALSAPGLNHSLLFQVHVGIAKARRGQHITAKQHCCEVCRSMDQCVHWNVVSGSKEKGSKGTCALYGSRVATLTPAATSPTIETAVLLLRSDVQKLQTLTRCHVEIVRWLQSQLVGEAELELLVDATGLASTAAISRARDQLRAALHAPAFLYTAEELERTFPAVRQWPSPAHHDPSRNRLKGDAVRLWWAKVLKLQRPALGPRVAQRLISYLIHEPSIVLWARRRAEAARLRDGGAPPAASSGGRLRDESALPRYTWVIEDDAVFVGDLRGFLRLFRPPSPAAPAAPAAAAAALAVPAFPASVAAPTSKSGGKRGAPGRDPQRGGADLVTTFANLEGNWIEASSHDWKVNGAFADAFGDRRVHKWEHVEGFSPRLIRKLDDLLSVNGAAAHGEMFGSTVCMATPWCVAADLRLAGVVALDAAMYGPSQSVLTTTERWERRALFERHRARGAPGVWLHAVKNTCNALALWSNDTIRVSADDPSSPFVVATLGEEATTAESRSPSGMVRACEDVASEAMIATGHVANGHERIGNAGIRKHVPNACEQADDLLDPLSPVPLADQGAPFCA